MAEPHHTKPGDRARQLVTRAFTLFEDAVYIGLGAVLAYCALALLVTGGRELLAGVSAGAHGPDIVQLLDQSLLVLMVLELLYTLKVSFREHTLVPEPFLVVGLIAATRRILVLTAQFSHMPDSTPETFFRAMIEAGVLTVMVLALVASLFLLRPRTQEASKRAPAGKSLPIAG
jgi:uncharacterized membrane protein (DUF373 family)